MASAEGPGARRSNACSDRRGSAYAIRSRAGMVRALSSIGFRVNGGVGSSPVAGRRELALFELVGLLFEGLLARDLGRQDSIEILDLLVLDVVLELLFELHLLAQQRALRVGPQVGRLGGGREADLAVVAGVLEDLANDQPDVLVAQGLE